MSHEIRTPLNAIMGFSDILCESQISSKIRKMLQLFQKCQIINRIINDVLDISKIESGKLDVVNEAFFFESFIEQIIELFSVAAKREEN